LCCAKKQKRKQNLQRIMPLLLHAHVFLSQQRHLRCVHAAISAALATVPAGQNVLQMCQQQQHSK
jgi:hypothetical protein